MVSPNYCVLESFRVRQGLGANQIPPCLIPPPLKPSQNDSYSKGSE